MYRQAKYDEPLIFELGHEGRTGLALPEFDIEDNLVPEGLMRKESPKIPSLTEVEVVRHYTRLSQMNFGVDLGLYPLGSCTMKYNPKFSEELAALAEATEIHPFQDESTVQGALRIMYELQHMLCKIGGMDAVTLQPAAGAHGEFTGLLIAKAYHELNGEERTEVVLPDTAHGTNPASAALAGFSVVEIPSKEGTVDLDALKSAVNEKTAAFMLTNPNTLGIFESEVLEIAKIVHDAGALLYYDGANFNAILGKTTPGDMNFDIMHFNLHKTFATPHGGGGAGAGPVGVKAHLAGFLPVPVVGLEDGVYYLDYDIPHTIGKVKSFFGNFSVLLKAYAYIKLMGGNGLTEASEIAVLNANYMRHKLTKKFEMPYRQLRKHEFVLSGSKLKERGLKTMDAAKFLLDHGIHAPTVYFPHIVDEAIMTEPTETEPKEVLDEYIRILNETLDLPPERIKSAPMHTAISRVDEVTAARKPILSYKMIKDEIRVPSQKV